MVLTGAWSSAYGADSLPTGPGVLHICGANRLHTGPFSSAYGANRLHTGSFSSVYGANRLHTGSFSSAYGANRLLTRPSWSSHRNADLLELLLLA